MLGRAINIVIILFLMIQIGCARRVPVDVYPIRRPSTEVKPSDKVTAVLREEMNLKGTLGADSLSMQPIELQTMEVTGQLVKWDEKEITIRVVDYRPGKDANFVIPIDQLEQVDEWPSFKPGRVLSTIAGTVVVLGITFLLVWALSKP